MTQDQDFQYVVSRQDYHDFKHSKAKCQELTKMLSQVENLNSADKEKYLSKIQRLQGQLKSYKSSVRSYVDRQIKQIDELLKILNDYRSNKSQSSLNMASLAKIKSECEKINQTFNVSLKTLEILNSEVIVVIKSLVQDSLALHEKLKQYSGMYENAMQQKQDLYVKIKQMNEKSVMLEMDKSKFIKNQQRLKYQNEILKYSLKQKEAQNTQLEINIENLKNKSSLEAKSLKEQKVQCEKRWKESLEDSVKLMQKEIMNLKNDKLIATKSMIEEIERLRQKLRGLCEESNLKDGKIKKLEIAYRQQLQICQQFKAKTSQTQDSFRQRQQLFKNQCEKSKQNYQRQLEKIKTSYEERYRTSSRMIDDLQRVINQQHESKKYLERQMKEKESRFIRQIEEFKQIMTQENDNLSQMVSQLRKELGEKSTQLQQNEKRTRYFGELENEYQQKYQLQDHVIQQLKKQIDTTELNYSELDTKLALKTEQLKKMEHQFTKNQQLTQQIDQLRKVIAICQSEKTILEEKTKKLYEELVRFKKLYQQSTMKLNNENQQLIIQLKITVDNLEKKKAQNDQTLKALEEVRLSKNNIENQFCQLSQMMDQEKKKAQSQIFAVTNQIFMLREALEEKQIAQENIINEIEALRTQARNGLQARQASNLLKMDLEALQNDVHKLNKEKAMAKKEKQAMCEELNQIKTEIKFLNDDLNSMKQYIEQLEHNLEKLSEEKSALKNEVNLFKEQAEFCKHESIEQLGIIDHLERELQSVRKQLKNAAENIDPSAIVRRSSLSKGEKAYYVKQMILEYGNEMKKNLLEIGALSPDQIRDLISSELRELGNYVKNLQKEFY